MFSFPTSVFAVDLTVSAADDDGGAFALGVESWAFAVSGLTTGWRADLDLRTARKMMNFILKRVEVRERGGHFRGLSSRKKTASA
jgi:hypothetical protein